MFPLSSAHARNRNTEREKLSTHIEQKKEQKRNLYIFILLFFYVDQTSWLLSLVFVNIGKLIFLKPYCLYRNFFFEVKRKKNTNVLLVMNNDMLHVTREETDGHQVVAKNNDDHF
jgi:hypothetical protein